MTIALAIKVNDGVVLAADSATTIITPTPGSAPVIENIYNNANKIFNLHKGLPIGALTWGLGNVGPVSIATLAKDLRRALHGDDAHRTDWCIADPDALDVQAVVARAREYLWEERYVPAFGDTPATDDEQRTLGFLVAGYDADADQPRLFLMNLGEDGGDKPTEILADGTGAAWWGQPEAIARIVNGVSNFVPVALKNMGVDDDQVRAIYAGLRDQVRTQIVSPAMPIQDAIDLAEFLVHATIQFVRFGPGNPTVGGPIEIATITKHEGFKWVKRKHYFDARFNPAMESK